MVEHTVTQYIHDPNTTVKAWVSRISSPIITDAIHLEVFRFLPGVGIQWDTRVPTFLAGSAVDPSNDTSHSGLQRLLRDALVQAGLWEEPLDLQRDLTVTLSCRRERTAGSEELAVIRVRLVGSELEPVHIHRQLGLEQHHTGLFAILRSAIEADGKWRLEKRPPPGRRFE